MTDNDWTNIDIKTFLDCTNQMEYNELLYNNSFNSERAMKSITLGSNRTDSHLIADGMHATKDYIEKNNYLPDENITPDEIRKIQGRVLDCMIARFNGINLFQSVLTCIYVHRDYKIKNPLLKLVINSYIYIVEVVEEFVNKYKICSGYAWANDGGRGISYLPDRSSIDASALRNDLEELKKSDASLSDIVSFSTYMLDFAEYLLDFQNKTAPGLPEIPKESSPIGFSDVLHNRQLSTSSPPLTMQILSHEESIEKFTAMVNLISSFKDIPKPTSMLEIVTFLYQWTIHNSNAVILARVVLNAIFFPKQSEDQLNVLGWPNYKQFLTSELKSIHLTDKLFSLDKEVTIDSTVYSFLIYYTRPIIMPICIAHSSLEKHLLQYWKMIQNYLIASVSKTAKFMSFPKTDSEGMNELIENPMRNWTERITVELIKIYLQLGIKAEIYNPLDYLQIFLFFNVTHKALKNICYNERLISKVYEASNFQGQSKGKKKPISSSNVNKRMGDESNKEIEEQIIADYYEYCIYLMQFVLKTKSIKLQSNEFYNPRKVYEARKEPLLIFNSLQFIEYSNFEILYDPKNFQITHIQNSIKSKSNDIKELIKKLKSRPNPPNWTMDTLKKTVMSSLAIAQWKEGDTFNISFDEDCLPNFQLIKH